MTIPDDDLLQHLALSLGDTLLHQGQMLACAESCTGGYVSKLITDVPGSSQWFERAFVTYSNLAKTDMLGVPAELIRQQGAVSEATARAMAEGVLVRSRAHISLAITGIAGPGGGSPDKPVGTVWFAWAGAGSLEAERHLFAGDRDAVRRQAVAHGLTGLIQRFGSV